MITRKGFIASIGAALTGAASKALNKKEVPVNLTLPEDYTPPSPQWGIEKLYPNPPYPWEDLDFRTIQTLDKLHGRRRARVRLIAWIPSILCKPEDYKKRWELLKGRQYETRLGNDYYEQGGWWKQPSEYSNRRPTAKNIQDYMAEQNKLQKLSTLLPNGVRDLAEMIASHERRIKTNV